MGTGYVRNDTPNNIADGNVINASDLDGEFDAIQAAFNASTGHSHDGTTGEGPQIGTGGIANLAVTTGKIANDAVTLGTKTSGNYVATAGVSGVGLSGSASSEGATFTVTSNATSANTASTIVARDGSGNFSAGTITASLSGNATTATTASGVTANSVALGTDTTGNYVGTITGGTGIDSTGATSGEGVAHTLSLDLNELPTSTANTDGDYFVVVDSADGSQHKLTKANINLSGMNNDSGWTSNVGDITGVTAGTGLSGGGSSGSVTLNVDLSELTDMTATMVGTDEFIVLDAGSDRRKAANEIGLSIFNNDSGFTSNVGDITGVTAGTNLTGGGTSGTVTLNMATGGVGAGTYGSTSNATKIDTITVDAYGRVTAVATGATGDGDITGVTAGSGLSGGGSSGSVTLEHANTSSQASVNNSGSTFIQDVTLDTYGHVTSLTSATVTTFTSGTLMLFQQTSAPTGWTKQTTHNNKALRVVTGTASSGGSSAFTTAFGTPSVSGSVSLSGNISSTTLSTSQIPSHYHFARMPGNPAVASAAYANTYPAREGTSTVNERTGNTGGGGSHNHGHNLSGSLSSSTASINVQYVDLIIASKD